MIAQAITDPRLNGWVDTVITLGSPFGGRPGPIARGNRQRRRTVEWCDVFDGIIIDRRVATATVVDGLYGAGEAHDKASVRS